MGRIHFQDGERSMEAELSSRTLLGRHWSSSIIFHSEIVPQFWVEIRWKRKEWLWRALGGTGRTIGAGRLRESNWRTFSQSTNLGQGRIRCGEDAWFRLTDNTSPRSFARNLVTREEWTGEILDQKMENWDGILFRRAGHQNMQETLQDGDVVKIDRELIELYVGGVDIVTVESSLNLVDSETTLDIDLINLTAVFTGSGIEVEVRGEPVRTLAVFALARLDDPEGSMGWLSADTAYQDWLTLGGNPDSKPGRLGWDRGKLRNQLAKSNVQGIRALFSASRSSKHPGCRLNFSSQRITLEGLQD